MTVIFPEGVSTLANSKHIWVASIADPTKPELAELTASAPASLDISCMLYAGAFAPTQTVNRAQAPRRSCSRAAVERITTVVRSIPDISYVIDPQAATGSDGKKAYETLTEGLSGYIVERFGLDAQTEVLAKDDFVNVWPVTLSSALIVAPSEDGAEYQVTQAVELRGDPILNVKVLDTN